MSQHQVFQKNAQTYDAWYERNRLAFESELRAIQALLPQGKRGLEVGVGTGRFAAALGIRFGLDPARAMLDIARERNLEVVQGVAEALPFKASQFGLLLMVTTVCFLDEVATSLSEAARTLEPEGAILVGFINRETPLGRIYRLHQKESTFYREARFYSADEVAEYLRRAGFSDLVFVQTIFQDPERLRDCERVKRGHGEGCFTVVRGRKKSART